MTYYIREAHTPLRSVSIVFLSEGDGQERAMRPVRTKRQRRTHVTNTLRGSAHLPEERSRLRRSARRASVGCVHVPSARRQNTAGGRAAAAGA